MKTWSFFVRDTGELIGQKYSGPTDGLELNTPEGTEPIEGDLDHRCQRIDLASRTPMDWRPPRPGEDYEWIAQRWSIRDDIAAERARIAQTKQQIIDLEAKQPRMLRELALGDSGAASRLQSIDDQIAILRAQLNG